MLTRLRSCIVLTTEKVIKCLPFRSLCWIALCLTLTTIPLDGQIQKDIRFISIDNTDGLPGNGVTSIINDDLGFVWIGTTDGLCRYEGKNNVKIYRANQPEIEGGLKNSNIRTLFLDKKGNIWIGTRLGGLTKFHQSSNTWKTYRNDPNNPKSISNDEVLIINEDKEGRIWVGTENGLNVFDPETEEFTSFLKNDADPESISGKAVLSICIDDQQRIWIGTWGGGINLLIPPKIGDLSKSKFRHFFPSKDGESKNIWKIYQDRDNHYWVGSRGVGLFLMEVPEGLNNHSITDKLAPSFHQYKQFKYDGYINGQRSIANNHIEDIYQDTRGNLWIATVNGLSCSFVKDMNTAFENREKGKKPDLKFQNYTNNPRKSYSITNSQITSIFEDSQGLLWFGTNSGVGQYNLFTNQFEVYDIVEDFSKTPNTQNLYVDKKGIVWFGFGGLGIVNYNLQKNQQKLYNLKSGNFKDNYVFTLYSPDDKYLYIGSKKGIIILNMETDESKIYPLKGQVGEESEFWFIRSIFADDQKRVWIGTMTGLYVLNEKTGTFEKYTHHPNDPTSISDNSLNQVYQDSKGEIWITSFQGLNKVIDDTSGKMKFKSFKYNSDQPETSIPSNRIIALTEVNEMLYIGSNTGISGFDLKEEIFHNYSKNTYNKSIQSMEKTTDGNIWASTMEGILFFNPRTKEFNHYDKNDGLGDIIFQSGACYYHSLEGNMYFGSRQGTARFNPANLSNNQLPPPVYITDVRKMSPEGAIVETATYKDEIILDHNEYYLSIDFSALNYNRPEKNKFAFKLEGFQDKWNYPENKTNAVYTNLKPGTYTFKVKAANNDGYWNETGASLKIVKRPAFWQTWWFILLCLILFGALILFAFKNYTRNIKRRNTALQEYNENLNQEIKQRKQVETELKQRDQLMESLIKKRTNELEEKNLEVKKLLTTIRERNDHLEIEIDKRTKNLLNSNKELQRSNKDLEQFAYIASHDLQEPLRVVGNFIGLLRRRYKQHFDEEAFQYIDFAVDGVQRMSKQIKNVLIFSKVSQQEITFKITDINLVVQTKLHDLSERIEEKNVIIKTEDMPKIVCEPTQIKIVFFNLISNAIKFNKSETPTITISNHTTEDSKFWHFSVKDNGIGIQEKYKEKIFEIFRQLNNKSEYSGTGIGLALCQKIVHRHQGKIWIESEIEKGTTFHFTISRELTATEVDEYKKSLRY